MTKISPKLIKQPHSLSDLTDTDIENLEKAGGVKIDDSVKAAIERTLADFLFDFTAEQSASLKKPVDDIYKKLLTRSKNLADTLHEVLTSDEPAQIVIRDALDLHFQDLSSDANLHSLECTLNRVRKIQSAVKLAKKSHEKNFGGKTGPSQRLPLRGLIINLCSCFEKAGGVASAAYQDLKGYRDTPFLRFLSAINDTLPEAVREKNTESMFEYAAKVAIPAWKEIKKKNSS